MTVEASRAAQEVLMIPRCMLSRLTICQMSALTIQR